MAPSTLSKRSATATPTPRSRRRQRKDGMGIVSVLESATGETPVAPDRDGGDWQVDRSSLGWITVSRPVSGYAAEEHLSVHAGFEGPMKLVRTPDGMFQRIDLFLGTPAWAVADRSLDEDAWEEHHELLADLNDAAAALLAGNVDREDWQAPPADAVLEWLVADGRAAAVDQDGKIRLTISRPACDGQACFECRPEGMRISMPLGTWHHLAPGTEAAMVRLADEANARTRLVRIAWLSSGDRRQCVAQVDLTGLPTPWDRSPALGAMWRGMIEMAMAGLELALRRLGRELAVLASGSYPELVRAVGEEEPFVSRAC